MMESGGKGGVFICFFSNRRSAPMTHVWRLSSHCCHTLCQVKSYKRCRFPSRRQHGSVAHRNCLSHSQHDLKIVTHILPHASTPRVHSLFTAQASLAAAGGCWYLVRPTTHWYNSPTWPRRVTKSMARGAPNSDEFPHRIAFALRTYSETWQGNLMRLPHCRLFCGSQEYDSGQSDGIAVWPD